MVSMGDERERGSEMVGGEREGFGHRKSVCFVSGS